MASKTEPGQYARGKATTRKILAMVIALSGDILKGVMGESWKL